jgi:tetratricopeptide (TPR) repeat protein
MRQCAGLREGFATLHAGMQTRLSICAALALVTALLFADVRNAGFLSYDDDVYVTASPQVRQGLTLESLRWSLTAVISSNWHPVTLWSLMLDVSLFGVNARAHHLVNLVLHIANVLLLFLLLARMTGAAWRSAFVAALFAVHPLHVESVAWISERKDVLSALFWLGTVWFYVSYTRTRSRATYAAALALLCLGLMTKSMLVTLPVVLLLFDVWPLARLAPGDALRPRAVWPLLREKIPLFAATLAIAAAALATQGRDSGPMWSLEQLPLDLRIENAAVSVVRYLGKAIWPSDLAVFYPHPIEWPTSTVLACVAAIAALTAAAAWLWRRAPYLGVGWLFYLCTLAPTLGLIQVGNQAMADRYSYLPLLGVFWAVSWGAAELASALQLRHCRALLATAAAAALAGFSLTTYLNVPLWRDTLTLFEHALDVTRDNSTAHATVAFHYLGRGELDRALEHADAAIRISPSYALAHEHRGRIEFARGAFAPAAQSFERALDLGPAESATWFRLARAHERAGSPASAETAYRSGLTLEPDRPQIQNHLAGLLLRRGATAEARELLETVLERHPDLVAPRENLRALDRRERATPD